MSAIARNKLSEVWRWGGHGGIPISVKAVVCTSHNNGSLFYSSPCSFRRGTGSCSQWRGVCNSDVSVRRESNVYAIVLLNHVKNE